MPWNLPLWWQLRCLRRAVEIDCDARVLRRGYDVSRYGETLIAIGERQSATIAIVAAMVESRPLLEQRIRNMLQTEMKYAHAMALGFACVGIAFAVGAAEVSPPNSDSAQSASQQNVADSKILDGYVGFYQLNSSAVMTITRTGQQLNAQLTGQPALPIYARSNTEFSYKDAEISFITDPDGQTTSLILRKYGVNVLMKRIDAATAQQIPGPRPEPLPGKFGGGALIMRQ